jgi:hypothetical protein
MHTTADTALTLLAASVAAPWRTDLNYPQVGPAAVFISWCFTCQIECQHRNP